MRPRVRRHGAVAGEVLPLLDAHTHVGTRVLLAGRARACEKAGWRVFGGREGGKREIPTGNNSQATVGAAAEP